ncbi:MAG: cytochrome c-type biogenesis protein CcmH, partial [Methanosarcinales archaeon]
MRSIKILILIIAYIYILTISVIPVQAELTVEDISKNLRCQCGCALILADCAFMNCGVADEISTEIKQMITEGKSKEQIIENLKLEYGREIYATPPKKGFDWS